MYGLDLSRTGLTITPLAGLMYPGYAAPVSLVWGGGGEGEEEPFRWPNCGSGSSHLDPGFAITLKVEFYNLPSLFSSNFYYFYLKVCNILFNPKFQVKKKYDVFD
jgi:hypothetical protein